MPTKLHTFINQLPKSDLHVHLDGSIRLATLIELSKQEKLSLPSYNIAGLQTLVFKERYQSLLEYLQGFSLMVPTMQTPENLERISYEFAQDNIAENIFYVEARFAPHLHINSQQNIVQVLRSIDKGFKKAQAEHQQKTAVKTKKLPPFNYGIIVCALRSFAPGASQFLDQLIAVHQYANHNTLSSLASYELVKACVQIRDQYGIPIVAFDIAGAEAGNPPIHYQPAYHLAHQELLHLTAHAGEAYGAESIFQAVTELYPERIGHGYYLFTPTKIVDPKIKNKSAYIERLKEYMAANRITIEVCLTSNHQTIPELKQIKAHPFAKMLTAHISTAICTDNRTVSKTTLTKELSLAQQNFKLEPATLKHLIINAFTKSFYPGTYQEKLAYIKEITTYYDLVSQQHI